MISVFFFVGIVNSQSKYGVPFWCNGTFSSILNFGFTPFEPSSNAIFTSIEEICLKVKQTCTSSQRGIKESFRTENIKHSLAVFFAWSEFDITLNSEIFGFVDVFFVELFDGCFISIVIKFETSIEEFSVN